MKLLSTHPIWSSGGDAEGGSGAPTTTTRCSGGTGADDECDALASRATCSDAATMPWSTCSGGHRHPPELSSPWAVVTADLRALAPDLLQLLSFWCAMGGGWRRLTPLDKLRV
jgi:hypothetical protein